MLDKERDNICHFSRLVEGSIHVFDFSQFCQLLSFNAKLLYNTQVDEVFSGPSVEEHLLDGSLHFGMQQEGNMDAFLSSDIHGIW
jgi:hypothetical protein